MSPMPCSCVVGRTRYQDIPNTCTPHFLKTNIQDTNDGIVYQITSSDFELLQIFARFYEPIEK